MPTASAPAASLPSEGGSARRLANKIIVISGGTQGCGAGIARVCAHEGAEGIAICGRSEANGAKVAAELEALGATALYVRADLTDAAACLNFIAKADERFGRIDGLVNCAAATTRGTWLCEGGSVQASAELMDVLYKLNMRAPFLLTQAAAAVMAREGRGGSVVNIGSVNGHGGQVRTTLLLLLLLLLPFLLLVLTSLLQSNLPCYSMTKGALLTMTKHAAWALRRERIRCNIIMMGWTFTEAEDAMMQSEGKPAGWVEEADASMDTGRLLRPVDIAKQAVHLLSDDAVMQSGGVIDLHERPGLCCWDGQPESA